MTTQPTRADWWRCVIRISGIYRKPVRYLTGLTYLAVIVLANYLTSNFGLIPVGFGQVATAGTFAIGLSFVLRDATQDVIGAKGTYAVVLLGSLVSFMVADPFVALASASAFLVSETCDMIVYTPLRKKGYLRSALASNAVGSAIDTITFLLVAGFPLREAFAGQMVAKLTVSVVSVFVITLAWRWIRDLLRDGFNK